MRTVDVQDLQDDLRGCLPSVKDGDEIVVRGREIPGARIVSFGKGPRSNREEELIASGALKMPEEAIHWDEFFLLPAGNVPHQTALDAAVDSRGDR